MTQASADANIDLTSHERADLLAQLRDARALVLKDAESFHQAAIVLEHVGQLLSRHIGAGLYAYKASILQFISERKQHDPAVVERLFDVVKNSRNMAVHHGAWARHLNSRLIDLFLILEETIIATVTQVEDLMVRTPLIAHDWHRIADVRKMMLANSFSSLPILARGQWRLITDRRVVEMMAGARSTAKRNKMLAMKVDEATSQRLLSLEAPHCCAKSELVADIIAKMNDLPLLVVDDGNLVGILTAFDLL